MLCCGGLLVAALLCLLSVPALWFSIMWLGLFVFVIYYLDFGWFDSELFSLLFTVFVALWVALVKFFVI